MTIFLLLWAIAATCLFFIDERNANKSHKASLQNLFALELMTATALETSRRPRQVAEHYVRLVFSNYWYGGGPNAKYADGVLKTLSDKYSILIPYDFSDKEVTDKFLGDLTDAVSLALERDARERGIKPDKPSNHQAKTRASSNHELLR